MEKILIIDDDDQLTELLTEFLESYKYDIIIKHTPEEGLKYLEKNEVNIIILDIMLPKMDGLQLAMYLSKELTSASLSNIGTHIGGRDHSTVIHACKNIDKKTREDNDFKRKIEKMKNKIYGQRMSIIEKGNT